MLANPWELFSKGQAIVRLYNFLAFLEIRMTLEMVVEFQSLHFGQSLLMVCWLQFLLLDLVFQYKLTCIYAHYCMVFPSYRWQYQSTSSLTSFLTILLISCTFRSFLHGSLKHTSFENLAKLYIFIFWCRHISFMKQFFLWNWDDENFLINE